ncbi:MAG: 5-(carboxyamino)imidazole ribonucleotide mutase [Candidatus Marisimplicoccus sp.]|jgi:5-(carboxyamino)imidazole ribonucleotide mutase|nr:5-(carboxyamino)imidazole ribonucleotide mutase [Flavobacteriaceae bacterium]RZP01185.1 MAG: 5-(carboxyamino)imidazole ribonucleotide mutase [Flavobacteriales bacterium]|tara:strand:+ start:4363 stop:4854 length:492 start_codon:yes stop_codon:yes gene_type:complete
MNKVAIIMGSKSDFDIMSEAIEILKSFGIKTEHDIVSAHRTPNKMIEYAENAELNGIKVIIAGAGGAAHLPGMVASITSLPVIGVPIKSRNSIDGWDSILSILQMPGGVPVATVALNGSKNAGILAAQIIGSFDSNISQKVKAYKKDLENKVLESSKDLKEKS